MLRKGPRLVSQESEDDELPADHRNPELPAATDWNRDLSEADIGFEDHFIRSVCHVDGLSVARPARQDPSTSRERTWVFAQIDQS